jgi:hypothetical protein
VPYLIYFEGLNVVNQSTKMDLTQDLLFRCCSAVVHQKINILKMGTFVQNVHSFLIRSSTSGFLPDATNRVTQELVTPEYRATSAPE